LALFSNTVLEHVMMKVMKNEKNWNEVEKHITYEWHITTPPPPKEKY
jgi:hypothetical protein